MKKFKRVLSIVILLPSACIMSVAHFFSDSSSLTWKTETCNSDLLPVQESVTCLSGRKIAFMGDSILRNIFVQFILLQEAGGIQIPGKVREKVNNGAIRYILNYSSKLRKVVESPNIAKKRGGKRKRIRLSYWSYRTGDVHIDMFYAHSTHDSENMLSSDFFAKSNYTDFVVSNALWDMGLSYRGHSKYFRALSKNLAAIEDVARHSSSKIILLGLHFIDTERCTSDYCRVCNDELVQEYIRRVQQNVVSCTERAVLLDYFQITNDEVASSNSHDGVHFNDKISSIQLQFILQVLCSIGGECSVMQRPHQCDFNIPTFDHDRRLKSRTELRSKARDVELFKCFADRKDSIFWSELTDGGV